MKQYTQSYGNFLFKNITKPKDWNTNEFPGTRTDMRNYLYLVISKVGTTINYPSDFKETITNEENRIFTIKKKVFGLENGKFNKFEISELQDSVCQSIVTFFKGQAKQESILKIIQKIFLPDGISYEDFTTNNNLVNQYLNINTEAKQKTTESENLISQQILEIEKNILNEIRTTQNETHTKLDEINNKTTETKENTGKILDILNTITNRKNMPKTLITTILIIFGIIGIFSFTRPELNNIENKRKPISLKWINLDFKTKLNENQVCSDKPIDLTLSTAYIQNVSFIYLTENYDWGFTIDPKGEMMSAGGKDVTKLTKYEAYSNYPHIANDSIFIWLILQNSGTNTFIPYQITVNLLSPISIPNEVKESIKNDFYEERGGVDDLIESEIILNSRSDSFTYSIENNQDIVKGKTYKFYVKIKKENFDLFLINNIYRFNIEITGKDADNISGDDISIKSDKQYLLAFFNNNN